MYLLCIRFPLHYTRRRSHLAVGGMEEKVVEVRVVAATNAEL